ncbi:MAG: hypothetical protein DDT19_00695 [Syntrophomonadaceae bacterium]|nr:hypothetical protein [Bacillota bacterium]
MLKLTDPESVNVQCVVTNEDTGERRVFRNFILVGKTEDLETVMIAADLRDLARAVETLNDMYKASMNLASPKVRREVEADLIVEAMQQFEIKKPKDN